MRAPKSTRSASGRRQFGYLLAAVRVSCLVDTSGGRPSGEEPPLPPVRSPIRPEIEIGLQQLDNPLPIANNKVGNKNVGNEKFGKLREVR